MLGRLGNGETATPRQVTFGSRNTSSVATKEHGRSTSPKPIPLTTSAWCLDDLTKECSRVSFQKNDTKENNTVELT